MIAMQALISFTVSSCLKVRLFCKQRATRTRPDLEKCSRLDLNVDLLAATRSKQTRHQVHVHLHNPSMANSKQQEREAHGAQATFARS